MGDITRKIELYNKAYALAWAEVSKNLSAMTPNTAQALASTIRLKINAGVDDAETVAVEAVLSLARPT